MRSGRRPLSLPEQCGRDAAGSAQGREDGEEEAAGDAARRVRDEAEAALRRRQQACMEVCPTI